MALSHRIQLNYQPVYTRFVNLSSEEWTQMVRQFVDKLAEKPVGGTLVTNLIRFIESGYKILIQNHDYPTSRTVFPKIRYVNKKTVLIVVPSVPYFTTVETVDPELCKDVQDKFFTNLSGVLALKPAIDKLDFSSYKFLLSSTKQTGFISLAHELIHCLRMWEGMNQDDPNEEDNTIYGIAGSVLTYHNGQKKIYICENAIRQEWGMKPRVTHDCKEIFCMYVPSTHSRSSQYTKQNYWDYV